MQSKCRPRDPETRKGKEDACFLSLPHFLSNLCFSWPGFGVFYLVVGRFSRAKAKPRMKKKTMKGEGAVGGGGGTRGEGSAENRLQTCKQPRKSDAVNGIPDWPTECQPVHTNFKGILSVVMRLTSFVFAQKKIQYLDQYLARQVLQF